MEKTNFYKKMAEESEKIGIKLPDEQLNEFYEYMQLLLEWNEKMNLTAITDPEEVIKKHFVDSITIKKYIKEKSSLIDVGTGAGFPGIPLKIVDKSIKLTLLDSLNKRINFLNEVIKKLNLKEVNTIHSRAEEYAKNKVRESYDVAVSRAVADLPILLEYLMPYVKLNGICICMKGPKAQEELERSKKAINILGGKLEKVEKITIDEEMERKLIIIRKIKDTPNKYPRKAGVPTKNPIV